MAWVKGGEEGEFRQLLGDFVDWSREKQLQKTREMVLDFRRNTSHTH